MEGSDAAAPAAEGGRAVIRVPHLAEDAPFPSPPPRPSSSTPPLLLPPPPRWPPHLSVAHAFVYGGMPAGALPMSMPPLHQVGGMYAGGYEQAAATTAMVPLHIGEAPEVVGAPGQKKRKPHAKDRTAFEFKWEYNNTIALLEALVSDWFLKERHKHETADGKKKEQEGGPGARYLPVRVRPSRRKVPGDARREHGRES